ncbi:cytochrome c biogenesis protein ResB [Paraburkholderia rhizosphaerae]|uniref:Cytochrome c biogenesis protein n=1 Tax=Paraburkholderia rhizosphaerae TaxID=480658 RepID=A0A4V6QCN6_9BURK|nr:cytochrome c biogenesis protein ResB [Paraburkholderia rhizosphaerae]TDY31244.1 cytochrome c biogenesis protein [Paraburkholderia rhizosphaerae]
MGFVTANEKARLGKPAMRRVLELGGSMRFAIALLVVLAIASTIGTVVEQGDPYPNYVNEFGPFWADVFRGLGIFDVYDAWWFVLILAFLIVSITLCVWRNGRKILADMRSWKDRVHERGLRAHRLHRELTVAGAPYQVVAQIKNMCGKLGYRFVAREVCADSTLIAAKRGTWSRLGYLSSHIGVIVICLGGLLDSELPVAMQRWVLHKTWTPSDAIESGDAESHRLAAWNPAYRGYAWVAEGKQVESATLFQQGESLLQALPFSIQLERFRVDYYSTGMPKGFLSDIVLTDHDGGKPVHATVSVNRPFTHDGVTIYQSGYQDGGSVLNLTAWPMLGPDAQGYAAVGVVGGSDRIDSRIAGDSGRSVEFTDFRAINVEDIDGKDNADASSDTRTHALLHTMGALLGSGAKSNRPVDKRNIGPSIQYKVRDRAGQAREFRNFMLPMDSDGARVFLAGVRTEESEPFKYIRIPADDEGTVRQWVALRAALSLPAMRAQAAQRFAQRTLPDSPPHERDELERHVQDLLGRFAGGAQAKNDSTSQPGGGGYRAVAAYIDATTTPHERREAAVSVLRTLRGVTWDLWQLSRARSGLPMREHAENDDAFVALAVDALSDSTFYGAPVLYQLNTFRQVQASILQVTRAPGEPIVIVGSVMLVAGIFAMFYVRERRLWFLVRKTEQGTHVLVAMSSMRGTLDVTHEFERLGGLVDEHLDGAGLEQLERHGPADGGRQSRGP